MFKAISKTIGLFGLTMALMSASLPARAFGECTLTPTRTFVGDDGSLWILWKEGGAGMITQADPDFKPTLLLAVSAQLANHQVIVRYNEGVSCGANPGEIIGLWLI